MSNVVVYEFDRRHGNAATCQGDLFDDITEQLATTWDFAPYPRCTLRQLQVVDRYIAAFASSQEPTTADETPDVETLVAVVGIVWVPLNTLTAAAVCAPRGVNSSAPAAGEATLPCVEGYIQLVLVAPTRRRRGLATRLLRRCLDTHTFTVRRAKDDAVRGASDMPRRILRWRLHTMLDTDTTRHYLRALQARREAAAMAQARLPAVGSAHSHSEDGDSAHTAENATVAEEVRAVCQMYEKMGFVRRRTLYRYYCGEADAVEMVCPEAGWRKTGRR